MRSARRNIRIQDRLHQAAWSASGSHGSLYVALGDSAGVGLGVDDIAQSYVGRIALWFAEQLSFPVDVRNLCVSGARAADVERDQLPRLEASRQASLVTLAVGGNDVAALRFDPNEFARSVDRIAERLPVGSLIGTIPRFGHWPFDARVKRANAAIEAAADRHGHTIADVYAASMKLPLRLYAQTLAADWFHPNRRGHQLWADAFRPHLSNVAGR